MNSVVKDKDISVVKHSRVVRVCQLSYTPSPFDVTGTLVDNSNSVSSAKCSQDIPVGKNKASVGMTPFATRTQRTDNIHRRV
ncbi:hypothetical protein ES703_51714 [subsurface metagenome]